MKSIKRNINKISSKASFSQYSSYMIFAYAIKGKCFSMDTITRHFNKDVHKGDYSISDKKRIIRHLYSLSNTTEETKK
jgi:hypothetical protein